MHTHTSMWVCTSHSHGVLRYVFTSPDKIYTFSSVHPFHLWPLLFWTGNKCIEGWTFPAHAQIAPPGALIQESWSCLSSACLGRWRGLSGSTCLKMLALVVGAISRWGQQSEVSAEVRGKWMSHFFCKWRAAVWSSLSRASMWVQAVPFMTWWKWGPKGLPWWSSRSIKVLCYLSLLQHALGMEHGLGVILAISTLQMMKVLWLHRKPWPAGYPYCLSRRKVLV